MQLNFCYCPEISSEDHLIDLAIWIVHKLSLIQIWETSLKWMEIDCPNHWEKTTPFHFNSAKKGRKY